MSWSVIRYYSTRLLQCPNNYRRNSCRHALPAPWTNRTPASPMINALQINIARLNKYIRSTILVLYRSIYYTKLSRKVPDLFSSHRSINKVIWGNHIVLLLLKLELESSSAAVASLDQSHDIGSTRRPASYGDFLCALWLLPCLLELAAISTS